MISVRPRNARRGPDHGVRQFEASISPYFDSGHRNGFGQWKHRETVEQSASRDFPIGAHPRQHLYPSDDADRGVRILIQHVGRSLRPFGEIDQDVGVEERPHHSSRMRL